MQVPSPELLDIWQLNHSELKQLIQAEGEWQQELFRQAREVRREAGVDEVRLRGVIEISNYCQKNCDYCAMRVANPGLTRYRMSAEEILAIAAEIAQTNISILFLQSGQDPQGNSILEEVIPEIKRRFNLQILHRIALKTPLIPTVSALEKIQPDGQLLGLNAGEHALKTIARAGLRLKVPLAVTANNQ